jgi:hypothetical protein
MARPSLPPWIVKSRDFPRLWIEPRQIAPLKAVAIKTTQRQVREYGFSTVLSGNDMVDLE